MRTLSKFEELEFELVCVAGFMELQGLPRGGLLFYELANNNWDEVVLEAVLDCIVLEFSWPSPPYWWSRWREVSEARNA